MEAQHRLRIVLVVFDDTGGPGLKCRARPMSKVCRRSAWKVIDVVVVNLRAGCPMVRTKVLKE